MNIYTIYIFGFIALLSLIGYALEKISQIKTGKKDRLTTLNRVFSRMNILLLISGLSLPIIMFTLTNWSDVPVYGIIAVILFSLFIMAVFIRNIFKENKKLKTGNYDDKPKSYKSKIRSSSVMCAMLNTLVIFALYKYEFPIKSLTILIAFVLFIDYLIISDILKARKKLRAEYQSVETD